jgi:hypothetical protein
MGAEQTSRGFERGVDLGGSALRQGAQGQHQAQRGSLRYDAAAAKLKQNCAPPVGRFSTVMVPARTSRMRVPLRMDPSRFSIPHPVRPMKPRRASNPVRASQIRPPDEASGVGNW